MFLQVENVEISSVTFKISFLKHRHLVINQINAHLTIEI